MQVWSRGGYIAGWLLGKLIVRHFREVLNLGGWCFKSERAFRRVGQLETIAVLEEFIVLGDFYV